MKHLHHIIPKHAGGTDDPANLIELTVEEHAEEHRKLYEEYGRWQDKVAWQALTGQISMSEASIEAWKNGTKKAGEKLAKMNKANAGKSYEERYGDKANVVKEKIRQGSLSRDWSISEDERERRRQRAIHNNPGKTSDPEVADRISKTSAKRHLLQNVETGETKEILGLLRWARENDLNPSYVKSRFRRNKPVIGWIRLEDKS